MEKDDDGICFAKQVWDVMEWLKDFVDILEYKDIVLGLFFLKYLSDKFEERYLELVEEGDGFEEDIDEYTYKNIFFVPPEARWSKIAKKANTAENGRIIDNAMKAIEDNNKSLKGILPKNFSRHEIDKKVVGSIIDIITHAQISEKEDKDILGRAYEYCLSMFAKKGSNSVDKHYTPSCVVKTLVSLLKPYDGSVYDPCCGYGGTFVQLKKFIENHGGNINKIPLYGQELDPAAWNIAKMNLIIHGFEADIGEHQADTFLNDLHTTLKADYVMANPPFDAEDWGQEQIKDDPRWKYGMPPKGNANFAWIQHMIYHSSPKGKIGLVLSNDSLSSTTDGEGKIRQAIVEEDLVECIVALPTQLFYYKRNPVCLWFLNRDKKQRGKTLFIDAREMGTMVSKNLRELTDEDIGLIVDTFTKFEEGTLKDEKGFCKVGYLEEIEKYGFILDPEYYVEFKSKEDWRMLF